MPTVLSTKKLAPNQKELLLNSGIGLVEYDAISINFPDFDLSDLKIDNAIFSSQNAVRAILSKNLEIENCFCVGDKTSAYAEKNNISIAEKANYAAELAQLIVDEHSHKEFHFFSGNRRRDELPQKLSEQNIKYTETQVYQTNLNAKVFESLYDGILFFSPSAVQSFTGSNRLMGIAFCIGETTAAEAKKYTDKIIVATRPTIENVITRVVTNFKKQ